MLILVGEVKFECRCFCFWYLVSVIVALVIHVLNYAIDHALCIRSMLLEPVCVNLFV